MSDHSGKITIDKLLFSDINNYFALILSGQNTVLLQVTYIIEMLLILQYLYILGRW